MLTFFVKLETQNTSPISLHSSPFWYMMANGGNMLGSASFPFLWYMPAWAKSAWRAAMLPREWYDAAFWVGVAEGEVVTEVK